MQNTPTGQPPSTAMPISTLPLPELAAFEAAARLGSFAKAAGELCITDSAVSHRIRHLENRLAVPLFERTGRSARLLPAGQRFAQCMADSLDRLRAASMRIDAMERRIVRIAVAPAIGNSWLLPRLIGFRQRHPSAGFEVASVAAADLESGFESDLLIHYGSGMSSAGDAVTLCSDDIRAVCAPAFQTAHGPFNRLEDFVCQPLLRHPLLSWASWTEGAFGRQHEPALASLFDDAVSMLEATAAGMGVALSTSLACERYIAAGRLVHVHPYAQHVSDYRAQLTASGAVKPAARAFFAWLSGNTAAPAGPAGQAAQG
jgi:LysR family glycine cleavage system transcriptional activator